MNIYIYIYVYVCIHHRDFEGPPIQGPPHCKLTCSYLALFSEMLISIRPNRPRSGASTRAPGTAAGSRCKVCTAVPGHVKTWFE